MTLVDQPGDWERKKSHVIKFQHIASGLKEQFQCFITNYSDSFNSSWNTESVYGRMDPLATFQNTQRTIELSWQVIADSYESSKRNLSKCQRLMKMLYPVYGSTTDGGISTMRSPPLLRMKLVNLAQDVTDGSGLVGFVNGFNFAPDLEVGFYDPPNRLYPKVINLSCSYTVIHTHKLGFDEFGDSLTNSFPYRRSGDPPNAAGVAARAQAAREQDAQELRDLELLALDDADSSFNEQASGFDPIPTNYNSWASYDPSVPSNEADQRENSVEQEAMTQGTGEFFTNTPEAPPSERVRFFLDPLDN